MIDYIVNEEKRTVAAVIKFNDEEAFRGSSKIYDSLVTVKDILSKNDSYGKKYFEKLDKMYFPKHISAKAVCSPEDEWNEEYGRQLAKQRLVKKIHKYRSDTYRTILKMVFDIEDMLDR